MRRHWVFQTSRFAGVGGFTTLVHVAAAYLASMVTVIGPFGANLIGFVSAFGVSYLGNFYWTFGKRSDHAGHIIRFAISSAFCFLLSNGIVFAATKLLQWRFEAALFVIALSIPPLSFCLAKFWAFRTGCQQKSEAPPSGLMP